MLVNLTHLFWLVASTGVIAWILTRQPLASRGLLLGAYATLVVVLADAVAWAALDQRVLHPAAALASGALILSTIWLLGQETTPGQKKGRKKVKMGAPSEVVLAIEQWPEAAALANHDGVLIWANPTWCQQHGVENPTGKRWHDFQAPADHRWQQLLEEADRHGAASGFLDHIGSEVWTSRAFLIAPRDGENQSLFLAAIRMSNNEATLRQQAREIGHNLNNVLSAVVGNVGLAIETPGLDLDLRADLQDAETGALRAAELIHGLQALARGDA